MFKKNYSYNVKYIGEIISSLNKILSSLKVLQYQGSIFSILLKSDSPAAAKTMEFWQEYLDKTAPFAKI